MRALEGWPWPWWMISLSHVIYRCWCSSNGINVINKMGYKKGFTFSLDQSLALWICGWCNSIILRKVKSRSLERYHQVSPLALWSVVNEWFDPIILFSFGQRFSKGRKNGGVGIVCCVTDEILLTLRSTICLLCFWFHPLWSQ